MIVAVASILFEAALRAFLAACVLWAGLRLLRVKNVRAQKAAWSIVLLAGLAMPLLILGHWFPAWAVPVWAEVRLPASWLTNVHLLAQPPASVAQNTAPPIEKSASAPPMTPVEPDTVPAPGSSDAHFQTLPDPTAGSKPLSAVPAAAAPSRPLPQETRRVSLNLFAVAWLVYLAVGAALLFRGLIGLGSSIRLWLQAAPVAVSSECGAERILATRSSSRISSPVNIGSGIVLPADYPEWPTEKLRAVLAHESSHVRQRDFYWQLLAGFYAAITWFSPLGWWLKHKLSELSEAISDRAGLQESASRSAYAQLLLEFAALPRPTLTGVAMARSTNLSHRIDRLLNESSFKQAFSGGRRAFVAALIVPAVLVLAASMVRVQAAPLPQSAAAVPPAAQSADQPVAMVAAQSPAAGQSGAPQTSDQSSDQAPAAPATPPAPPVASSDAMPQTPVVVQTPEVEVTPVVPPIPPIHVEVHVPPMPPMAFLRDNEGHAPCFANGDAYAIVDASGAKTRFCGTTGGEMEAEVEKARTVAHGTFLLFRHDGKYYVVDDPAVVSQVEEMNKAPEGQGDQMRALGEQFRDAGRQVREQGRDEAQKATLDIPAPDLSKETAELDATVASLKEKQGGTITREQLQEVQREVQAIQRRVIDAEVKAEVKIDMSAFNAEESKFNEQMGKMGAELGRMVQENQQKMDSIIDQSLKNGQAKPVN